MLDLAAQYSTLASEIRSALDEVVASQQFVLGPQLAALESELAHYAERKFAIGVASGTDAIMLGLRACGVRAGDEVIVPTFTFVATAGAASAVGARPVFADCDANTLQLDVQSVRSRITPRTKAIVVAHLYGGTAEMDRLTALAADRHLPLIEDNAQSLGARYQGRKVGSFGTISTTSFYPSKNLGAYGDAGMIFTDSQEIAARLAALRNHGQKPGPTGRYISIEPGWNSRLDDLQAAVLRVKLRHLDQWLSVRRVLAEQYAQRFAGMTGIRPVAITSGCDHSHYLFTVRITSPGPNPAERRDHVARSLAQRNIGTSVFYPVPLHLQPLYQELGGKPGDLPAAERAAQEVLSLPLYPEMTTEQIDRVADGVAKALCN